VTSTSPATSVSKRSLAEGLWWSSVTSVKAITSSPTATGSMMAA
jgi:hypothetical protein